KIARDNINNVPLIRHAGKTGRPLIFDAGIVYLDEIARAVRLAQDAGAGGVVVNHHPGANPAPPEVHNMRVMQSYKEALRVPVGLACHYRGDEMLYVAVAMGANLLEKGVVDDPDRVEQDLVSAARLGEVNDIIRKVHNCWKAIGPASPSSSTSRSRRWSRRSRRRWRRRFPPPTSRTRASVRCVRRRVRSAGIGSPPRVARGSSG